jgi:hypothetical protein
VVTLRPVDKQSDKYHHNQKANTKDEQNLEPIQPRVVTIHFFFLYLTLRSRQM